LIPSVIDTLKPLEQNFNVITLLKNKGIKKSSITFNYNQTKNKWQKRLNFIGVFRGTVF
jgi:hypothetical protein